MTVGTLNLPDRTIILDGGMGRELRFRGVEIPDTIWSANGLLVAPEVVLQIHLDYIAAGADIITTNTYGVVRKNLAKIGMEGRFAELNRLAPSNVETITITIIVSIIKPPVPEIRSPTTPPFLLLSIL